jgi:5S rRNA maturation endonuclease (ribonuclease M5)
MNREDKLAIMEKLIEEIIAVNKDIPVIVEGERDEKSLRSIGFSGQIMKLNIGKSIFNFAEELVDYNEILILTDWDKKGKELRIKLKNALKANSIKANDSYWLALKHLCARDIKEVEFLHVFLENLRNE